ncbi:hypothetical protein SDC9_196185 [bioreactor metagenome]|uniref:Uncharacterized protein n=1 Tax=bioreactor metagenome TaxID=1076179 RepID=A0A645IBC7_9ZZZZ
MDDPVVVNPDMVSKKASVRLGTEWLKINGKLPKNENTIQTNVTMTKPSRFPNSFRAFLVKITKEDPLAAQIRDDCSSAKKSGPRYITDTTVAINMATASTSNRKPRIRSINLKFSMKPEILITLSEKLLQLTD